MEIPCTVLGKCINVSILISCIHNSLTSSVSAFLFWAKRMIFNWMPLRKMRLNEYEIYCLQRKKSTDMRNGNLMLQGSMCVYVSLKMIYIIMLTEAMACKRKSSKADFICLWMRFGLILHVGRMQRLDRQRGRKQIKGNVLLSRGQITTFQYKASIVTINIQISCQKKFSALIKHSQHIAWYLLNWNSIFYWNSHFVLIEGFA